ncbi:MAG: hypothetical protein J1F39_05940 [Clostridiales bacterium]|nr:hypothetical protein [Clostridiales bacterium]
MKYIKFILLGVSTVCLILAIVLLVPLTSDKIETVGTGFSKGKSGINASIHVITKTKYKLKQCDVKVTYYDKNKNEVTVKNIHLDNDQTRKEWYDELSAFFTEPEFITAEVTDYEVDYGPDILLEVLCWLAFVGFLFSAVVLFKKRI